MAQPVGIDTDILIDFGRDRKDAVQSMAILEKKYQLTTSVITAMELYTGCRSKRDLNKVGIFQFQKILNLSPSFERNQRIL